MGIVMAGIDFHTAPLVVRELFSFTSRQAADAMREAVEIRGVQGCVIFCTCNRTEMWLSILKGLHVNAAQILCCLKNIPYDTYKDFIVQKDEERAALHLFETAAGLDSLIKWEDRVLGQVKEALQAARDAKTTDDTLERIFQSAIAAAKLVKTKVRPPMGAADAIACVTGKIRGLMPDIQGVRCLVIGSGEMGLSAARALFRLGADVTVTVRTYRQGLSLVPEGCAPVDYDGRITEVKKVAIVIGATRSPHYTLEANAVAGILGDGQERLFFDLACPRDFDPDIAYIGNTKLFNIEDISIKSPGGMDTAGSMAEQEALRILRRELEQYSAWRAKREALPLLQEASTVAADKIFRRVQKRLKDIKMDQKTKETVGRLLQDASFDVLMSMLFELQEPAGPEFIEGLKTYMERQYPQNRMAGGGGGRNA